MPHGFFDLSSARKALQIYDQKEYDVMETAHTIYKLTDVEDLEEAIAYIRDRDNSGSFGMQAVIGWRDEMGKMKYRSTRTWGMNDIGGIMGDVGGLLDHYGLDGDDIEEYQLDFVTDTQ